MKLDGTSNDAIRPATAEGTAYFWDKQGRVSVSLIWRTMGDFDKVSVDSSTVLCPGKTADKEVKAVVLQNYEAPLRKRVRTKRSDTDYLVDTEGCLKGGFVLPREIGENEIVCNASKEQFQKLDINIDMGE